MKQVVTTCPHCFNTLKNEYPDFGVQLEVVHHTDFLLGLLAEKKLAPTNAGAGARSPTTTAATSAATTASTSRRARSCGASPASSSSSPSTGPSSAASAAAPAARRCSWKSRTRTA